MATLFLCIIILVIGSIVLLLPYCIVFSRFLDDDFPIHFGIASVLGAFTLSYQTSQPFDAASTISKVLNFRTPLSRLFLFIANSITAKFTGVASDTAFIDNFFTPYSVIDKTSASMLDAAVFALIMTAISVIELYFTFIVFFPEIYIAIVIFMKKRAAYLSSIRYSYSDTDESFLPPDFDAVGRESAAMAQCELDHQLDLMRMEDDEYYRDRAYREAQEEEDRFHEEQQQAYDDMCNNGY